MNALCRYGISRAGYMGGGCRGRLTVEMELREYPTGCARVPGLRISRIHRGEPRFAVNHKRVLQLITNKTRCVRRKSFVVTTDSRHNLPVYPNLAGTITPVRVNQLWRADITYIRLRTEFIYLAVVLDAFSRRVIGWAVGRTLEAGLAVSALTMALRQRQPAPGMVHHSIAACSMPRTSTPTCSSSRAPRSV